MQSLTEKIKQAINIVAHKLSEDSTKENLLLMDVLIDCSSMVKVFQRDDGQPSELEMHRADYEAIKEAGFESPSELLAAWKHREEREKYNVFLPKGWTLEKKDWYCVLRGPNSEVIQHQMNDGEGFIHNFFGDYISAISSGSRPSDDVLESLWRHTKGIDPETGKAWLTPRMLDDAKNLEKVLSSGSEQVDKITKAVEWMLVDYEHLNTIGQPLSANWPNRVQAVNEAIASLHDIGETFVGNGKAVGKVYRDGMDSHVGLMDTDLPHGTLLYTHSVPVVPDVKRRYSDSPYEGGYADGWNACRAIITSKDSSDERKG